MYVFDNILTKLSTMNISNINTTYNVSGRQLVEIVIV